MRHPEIVICSPVRTGIGAFGGALKDTPATSLGAAVIRETLRRSGLSGDRVDTVVMGQVIQAGARMNPARQAAIAGGLPVGVPALTVNRVCGSGAQAIASAAMEIMAGYASAVIAGGMENMTLAPYLLPKARDGFRIGHQQVIDSMITDGLWDPYNNIHMGNCAEQCATKYKFTREQQDAYAIESFKRANAAQKDGKFAAEITPFEMTDAKGNVTTVDKTWGYVRDGEGRLRIVLHHSSLPHKDN